MPLLTPTLALQGCVSSAAQPQGQGKAPLPGWGPGLLCRPSGSRLGLPVTVAAPAMMLQHSGQGRAVLPAPCRSLECPGQWQHPAWGCWTLLRPPQTLLSSAKSLSCLLPSHISWWRLPFLWVGFLSQSSGLFKVCGPQLRGSGGKHDGTGL